MTDTDDTDDTEIWETIGTVGIDSACLMLVDPCNLHEAAAAWDGYLNRSHKGGLMPELPTLEGMATTLWPGFGDGLYEVEARYVDVPGWGRRVAEVRAVFIDDDRTQQANDILDLASLGSTGDGERPGSRSET